MNENEFASKIEELRKRLYRTAYLYLDSEADALDAVDEAVYKALISLKKLKNPEYFTTWITRILINQCKNELKRRGRCVPLDELTEDAASSLDTLPLRDAVSRLPESLKLPLILRYFGGLSIAETAHTLKIPQGTAATRLRRALSLLRLELSEEELQYESKY